MRALVWTCVVACGCDEGDGEDREAVILALEPDLVAGAAVFLDHCAPCHGADGSATTDGFPLVGSDVRGLAAGTVIEAVLVPPAGMLSFDTLPDQSIADVAAHVEGL
jgi:mono/diheme cytochrome c family protein